MTVSVAASQAVVPVFGAVLCAVASLRGSTWPGQELRRTRALFAPSGGGLSGGAFLSWVGERVGRWRRWGRERRELLCLPVGCAVALLGESVLPLIGAVAAVPLVRRGLATRRRKRERDRREAAVIDLCGAVAGDLRAGRQPGEALVGLVVVDLGAAWSAVPAAARFGGDVPEALRKAARQPGAEGLNGVAACWQVSVDGGAGLAAGLERVAAALSAERDQREDLHAQLAGTRSTGLMLAVLPVLALLMGSALGAAPLRVLLHTSAGLGCLTLGGVLECAGLAWTARIVRAAGAAEGGGRV